MKKTQQVNKNGVIVATIAVAIFLSIALIVSTIIYFVRRADKNKKSASEKMADISEFVDNDIVGSEGTVSANVAPELHDVISIGQLRTLSYTYNSINRVRGGENREVVYYVAYESNVCLGVDYTAIEYTIDEMAKEITVVLPELTVQSAEVNPETLDFIFMDDSYDNPNTLREAYSSCEEALLEEIADDEQLFGIARTNTYNEMCSLVNPFISEFYPDYHLTVLWQDEIEETVEGAGPIVGVN